MTPSPALPRRAGGGGKSFALILVLLLGTTAFAQDERTPTLGMLGHLRDVVLPGSELEAAPVSSITPIILRVTAVRAHGDAFRYDLEYYGLEAGRHDLTRYLRRADGSPAALPPLEVEVVDPALFPGELPVDLAARPVPAVGGYRRALIVAGIAWVAGLLAIALVGRRRRAQGATASAGLTTRDRLAALLASARTTDLTIDRQAELERLVIDAWRGRLDLRGLTPGEAMARLRADAAAGAALARLDAWLHVPPDRRAPLVPADLDALAPGPLPDTGARP